MSLTVVTYLDQIEQRRIRETLPDEAQARARFETLCKTAFAVDVRLEES